MKIARIITRGFIVASIVTMMAGCESLMDPSVSMGVDVGAGGVVPYGSLNFSNVFSPYYYDGPYWGPTIYNPPPARPWRPPLSVNNPPPRQPGGSTPSLNPGVGPVLRPNNPIPSQPATPNFPTGNGQRPGGNVPSQPGGSTPIRPGGR